MTWLVDWNVLSYHPILSRGAFLTHRWSFSYSTEHWHNQPPEAAKLSSAVAVLTSNAVATVTRKQSLCACGLVCCMCMWLHVHVWMNVYVSMYMIACVGLYLCVYEYVGTWIRVCVYKQFYYHMESRASCVY